MCPEKSAPPLRKNTQDTLAWGALLLIMGLAVLLRMGWPTLSEFKRDEATVVRQALAIAYEGYLPAIGVDSSVGIDNLPLTLYLMALPLRLWRDPLSAILFTAFLNSLAVLACYLLGKASFNRWVGLVAALLFAVNPWAILYARKIWCRTMPLFTILFMASLVATFVYGKRWALVGALAGLSALLGLQLEGLAFVPIFGLAFLLYRDKVAWKPLLVGTALFTLSMAPYGIHDARHGWDNLRGLLGYTEGGGTLSWEALRYALMLTGSAGIEGQAGALYPAFRASVPNLWWLNGVMMALLAAALAYALYHALRGKSSERRRLFTLLSLWFWVPVLLQLRRGADTQFHYFVTHYPVQFLLVAIMLVEAIPTMHALGTRIKRTKGKRAKSDRPAAATIQQAVPVVVLTLFLLVWASWQSAVAAQRLTFMAEHPSTGGYGIPLRYSRQAAQAAKRLAGSAEILVLHRDTRPLITEGPTVFDALLFGHPHRFADARWALPLPESGEAVYLLGPVQTPLPEDLQTSQERLESLAGVTPGPMTVLPDNGWVYHTYHHAGPEREDMLDGMNILPEGIPFANKVIVAATQFPDSATPGETLELWLAWWQQGPPPAGMDYHFTAQLLDQNDTLRSQHDHAGFPSDYWQPGDLVLSRFAIPIPPDLPSGRYTVRVGLYTYPDIAVVPVVDASGNPVDSGVTCGQVRVGSGE